MPVARRTQLCGRYLLFICISLFAAPRVAVATKVAVTRVVADANQTAGAYGRAAFIRSNGTAHIAVDRNTSLRAMALRLLESTSSRISDIRSSVVPGSARLGNPWPRCSSVACYRVWALTLGAIPILLILAIIADLVRDTEPQSRRFDSCAEQDGMVEGQYAELLRYLSINKCGGLVNVGKLIPPTGDSSRYFWAACTVVYAGFNICFSIWTDSIFLSSYLGWGAKGARGESSLDAYMSFSSRGSLFTVDMAAAVEAIELFGFAFLMASFSHQVVAFLWYRASQPYVAFRALEYAFDVVVLLSYFSAIMPVGAVHPALVFRRFEQWMAAPSMGSVRSGPVVRLAQMSYFWLSRLGLLIVGLLAFGAKITLVTVQCNSPYGSKWLKVATLACLMVQTLGATVLHRVLKRELLWIIFGGQDTQVAHEEALMMDVYIARLYGRIYEEYWQLGRRLDFLALGITLDHTDLQRLLFHESSRSKKEVLTMLATKSFVMKKEVEQKIVAFATDETIEEGSEPPTSPRSIPPPSPRLSPEYAREGAKSW